MTYKSLILKGVVDSGFTAEKITQFFFLEIEISLEASVWPVV